MKRSFEEMFHGEHPSLPATVHVQQYTNIQEGFIFLEPRAALKELEKEVIELQKNLEFYITHIMWDCTSKTIK